MAFISDSRSNILAGNLIAGTIYLTLFQMRGFDSDHEDESVFGKHANDGGQ